MRRAGYFAKLTSGPVRFVDVIDHAVDDDERLLEDIFCIVLGGITFASLRIVVEGRRLIVLRSLNLTPDDTPHRRA
jgi:hypothetical protein